MKLLRIVVLVVSVAGLSMGCQSLNLRSQSPDENNLADEFETRVETPLIGQYINVKGNTVLLLQGVGLVTGLNNTGGDPPPSAYRTVLRDDMMRRGVKRKHADELLRSRRTALVVVRAYLPPLVRKGDPFDVEVRIPANSKATSLAGGWLMETRLHEHAITPEQRVLKGNQYARAEGSVLVSTASGNEPESAGLLRRGRVLGGAVSLKERDLTLTLRNEFRMRRTSERIANRIGMRFHHYDKYGQPETLATAKTDQLIKLKVHPRYRDNYPRYLDVIRSMALREGDIAERLRMQQLMALLNNSVEAEKAALQLEAIGADAIPFLKRGLQNPSLEVRFHASMALAYLKDPAGVPALIDAARHEPAFRVFAFAGLSALDSAEAILALKELMDEPSAETRYGAFRALSMIDDRDPFIRGEQFDDQFRLHVLDTGGKPMVHLTHRRKPEVVVFGAKQTLKSPILARAGEHLIVQAQPASETVTISRVQIGLESKHEVVSSNLADVIRKIAELGGTYPDVAQFLVQAERQHNLQGTIGIDTLPRAGRMYVRPQADIRLGTRERTRVGHARRTPNLFDSDNEPKKTTRQSGRTILQTAGEREQSDEPSVNSGSKPDEQTGTATAADVRESTSSTKQQAKSTWLPNGRWGRYLPDIF